MADSTPVFVYNQQSLRAAQELRASLLAKCIPEADALSEGFRCIASGWKLSRYVQCADLQKAIADLGPVDYRLVQKGRSISIWRKK